MTADLAAGQAGRIAAALAVAQAQNSGGWFVAGASEDVGRKESVARTIAGREVVLWRDAEGELVAGPGACPHLGALLDRCPVLDGTLFCRWHGLALTAERRPAWSPYRAYDDGVLVWVRLPTDGEEPTERPVAAAAAAAAGVGQRRDRQPGICEPQDVIANRLDPWHGSWFHPYAFSHLVVDDAASDERRPGRRRDLPAGRTWGCRSGPSSPARTPAPS